MMVEIWTLARGIEKGIPRNSATGLGPWLVSWVSPQWRLGSILDGFAYIWEHLGAWWRDRSSAAYWIFVDTHWAFEGVGFKN